MKLKNLFKSRETRHREKLLKDYNEGRVLKFETSNKKNMENKNNSKKKKKGKR